MVVSCSVVATWVRAFLVKDSLLRFLFGLIPCVRGRAVHLYARQDRNIRATNYRELGVLLLLVAVRRGVVVRPRFYGHEIVGKGSSLKCAFIFPVRSFAPPLYRNELYQWVERVVITYIRAMVFLVDGARFEASSDWVRRLSGVEGVRANDLCVDLVLASHPDLPLGAINVVDLHDFGLYGGVPHVDRHLRECNRVVRVACVALSSRYFRHPCSHLVYVERSSVERFLPSLGLCFPVRRIDRRILRFLFLFVYRLRHRRAFRYTFAVLFRLFLARFLSTGPIVRFHRHDGFLLQIRYGDVRPDVRTNRLLLVHVFGDLCRRMNLFVTRGVASGVLSGSNDVTVGVRRVVFRLGDSARIRTGVVRLLHVFEEDPSRGDTGLRTYDRRCQDFRAGRFRVLLYLRVLPVFGLRVRLLSFASFRYDRAGCVRCLFRTFGQALDRGLVDRCGRYVPQGGNNVIVPSFVCYLLTATAIYVIRRIIIRGDVVVVRFGPHYEIGGANGVLPVRVMNRRRRCQASSFSTRKRRVNGKDVWALEDASGLRFYGVEVCSFWGLKNYGRNVFEV